MGQKACVHVHGVLPYFFVRCEDDIAFNRVDAANEMLPELKASIETGMHAASEYKYGRNRGRSSRHRHRFIHQLQVCVESMLCV
jgi:hypothetical protein